MDMSGVKKHQLWGMSLSAGEPKKLVLKESDLLHLSQVTLSSSDKNVRSTITLTVDKKKYVLCSLKQEKTETWAMETSLYGPRDVVFSCSAGTVDLFGYWISTAENSATPPQVVAAPSTKAPATKRGADAVADAEPAEKKQANKKQKVETGDVKQTPAPAPAQPTEPKEKPQPKEKQPKEKQQPKEKPQQEKPQQEKQQKQGEKKQDAKPQDKQQKDTKQGKDEKTASGEENPWNKDVKEKKTKPQPRVVKGVKVEDLVVGKGKEASAGKKVVVHYTGRLSRTQKQFDSSVGRAPFSFRLGTREVIVGWDIGVEGMREGGKRKLHIPSKLGYGIEGAGKDIPPNADLEFDVQLLKVQ
eukprot:c11954_g1_i1.p1 GENE.c11954_g1_i1~~c11954_g1_i1.p1  ORF type:complete len:377 (-),score=154.39 c11954_g1_i1:300-1370(-)